MSIDFKDALFNVLVANLVQLSVSENSIVSSYDQLSCNYGHLYVRKPCKETDS